MRTRPVFTAALLTVLLSLAGCIQRVYEVRISPRADAEGWERVLTVTETRTEKDAQGREIAKHDKRVTAASFTHDIAPDMGNAGSITTYPTSLGTLTIYSERFRGQPAVADALQARIHAAEEAARLIGGWLKSESANWPAATDLVRWCDESLRADLRDFAVHTWLTGVDRGGARDPAHSAGWLRVLQFLTERGYLQTGDLPQVSRLLMGGADSQATHRWFVRIIARKAGDAPAAAGAAPPAFLRSWEATAASLDSYLRGQPEFDALVQRIKAGAKPGEEPAPADPKQVLGDQLGAMVAGMVPLFVSEAGNWSETLDLELAVPTEPFATNGRWRAGDRHVRWFTMLDGPDDLAMYPLHVFAQWVTPAEAAQERAFGSTALRGVNLAKYCLWRNGLSESEGQAWDDAIASLSAEANASVRLKAAGDRAGIPPSLLDSGIAIIRDGLGRTPSPR